MAEEIIFDETIVLKQDADISIIIQGTFAYSTGAANYEYKVRCEWDGGTIKSVAGNRIRDDFTLVAGKKGQAAGNHSFRVYWYGAPGMSLVPTCDAVLTARYR